MKNSFYGSISRTDLWGQNLFSHILQELKEAKLGDFVLLYNYNLLTVEKEKEMILEPL